MNLENKVAIVTGAASGMGRAIALGFAGEGATIVIVDIDERGANETLTAIKTMGGTGRVVRHDVADTAAAEGLVQTTVADFGSLDILVNNAGVGLIKQIWDYSPDEWDHLFDINVKGLFFLSSAASKQMIKQGSGTIINLASVAGRDVDPMAAAYCATKASVISITQSFAKALARHGIRVNAMAPGIVDTPYWKQVDREYGAILGKSPGEFWEEMSQLPPLGRPSVPEDVVGLAVFLAGDASAYMTGQTIGIDGGLFMV